MTFDLVLETIRECLHSALGERSVGPKFQLTADDYQHKESSLHNINGQNVNFSEYAPCVFATIRAAFGIGKQEFLESVAPFTGCHYIK